MQLLFIPSWTLWRPAVRRWDWKNPDVKCRRQTKWPLHTSTWGRHRPELKQYWLVLIHNTTIHGWQHDSVLNNDMTPQSTGHQGRRQRCYKAKGTVWQPVNRCMRHITSASFYMLKSSENCHEFVSWGCWAYIHFTSLSTEICDTADTQWRWGDSSLSFQTTSAWAYSSHMISWSSKTCLWHWHVVIWALDNMNEPTALDMNELIPLRYSTLKAWSLSAPPKPTPLKLLNFTHDTSRSSVILFQDTCHLYTNSTETLHQTSLSYVKSCQSTTILWVHLPSRSGPIRNINIRRWRTAKLLLLLKYRIWFGCTTVGPQRWGFAVRGAKGLVGVLPRVVSVPDQRNRHGLCTAAAGKAVVVVLGVHDPRVWVVRHGGRGGWEAGPSLLELCRTAVQILVGELALGGFDAAEVCEIHHQPLLHIAVTAVWVLHRHHSICLGGARRPAWSPTLPAVRQGGQLGVGRHSWIQHRGRQCGCALPAVPCSAHGSARVWSHRTEGWRMLGLWRWAIAAGCCSPSPCIFKGRQV